MIMAMSRVANVDGRSRPVVVYYGERRTAMDDPKALALANKQLIREAIAGYAVAAEYIEREKVEWLQRLTVAESWATFQGLVAFGQQLQGDPATLQVFEPRRIQDHLYMRQVFEKLARAQGLI